MKQYNCKNCGAPVKHTYNHRCEYCNSILDFNVPKEETIEVKPEELRDLELKDIEFVPYNNHIRFLFSGYKCTMPTIYECDINNSYVSSIEEYRNPPKCGFLIEIPRDEIEKYGFGVIRAKLLNAGLYPKELEKIKYQIIEKSDCFIRRFL